MNNFISAIRHAVKCENWHAALGLALALPDICGGLENPNEQSSRVRYERWFEQYLANLYRPEIMGSEVVFLSGADCYALRCSYLHGGVVDIKGQKARDVLEKFYFTTKGIHRMRVENTLTVNIASFCEEMCQAAEAWATAIGVDHGVMARMGELLTIHTGPFSPSPGVQVG